MDDKDNVFLQGTATQSATTQKNSPYAVASFVVAITTIFSILGAQFFFLLAYLHLMFPLAIVFGHYGIRQIARNPERYGGRQMALAGLMVGYFDLLLVLIVLFARRAPGVGV